MTKRSGCDYFFFEISVDLTNQRRKLHIQTHKRRQEMKARKLVQGVGINDKGEFIYSDKVGEIQ